MTAVWGLIPVAPLQFDWVFAKYYLSSFEEQISNNMYF